MIWNILFLLIMNSKDFFFKIAYTKSGGFGPCADNFYEVKNE